MKFIRDFNRTILLNNITYFRLSQEINNSKGVIMFKSYENYCFYRDQLGLTDYKVSQLSGVNSSTISDWKTERHHPNMKNLEKIAKALNVNPNVFFAGIPSEPKNDNKNEILVEHEEARGSSDFLKRVMLYSLMLRNGEKIDLTPDEYKELSEAIDIFIESWIRAKKEFT